MGGELSRSGLISSDKRLPSKQCNGARIILLVPFTFIRKIAITNSPISHPENRAVVSFVHHQQAPEPI